MKKKQKQVEKTEENIEEIKQKQQIQQIKYFDERYYEIETTDGQTLYLPSVTTVQSIVNKPFLAQWRGSIGNIEADRVISESQSKGSQLHALFEALQKGETIIYGDGGVTDQSIMLEAWRFQQVFDQLQPEIVAVEQPVYSLKFGYAGTLDAIWRIKAGSYAVNGRSPVKIETDMTVMIDFKTGKQVGDAAFEQLAAYRTAVLEMGIFQQIDAVAVLHTNAKTKTGVEGAAFLLRTGEQLETDFAVFSAILTLYKMKNTDKPMQVSEFPKQIKLNIKK